MATTHKPKEELKAMIEDGRWDDLLTKVPVKKATFSMCQAERSMQSVKAS